MDVVSTGSPTENNVGKNIPKPQLNLQDKRIGAKIAPTLYLCLKKRGKLTKVVTQYKGGE